MLTFENRVEMMRGILHPEADLCEVGVFLGEFSSTLLRFRPKRLTLIDMWEGQMISGDADGNNHKGANMENVWEDIQRVAKEIPAVDLRRGKSQDILLTLEDESYDMIYIDGDHSYEGVKRDLELAWPKVRKGGFLCGHDYEINKAKCWFNYNFGVRRAVDEFLGQRGLSLYAKALDGCVSWAVLKT